MTVRVEKERKKRKTEYNRFMRKYKLDVLDAVELLGVKRRTAQDYAGAAVPPEPIVRLTRYIAKDLDAARLD